jgi:hypothetical protein
MEFALHHDETAYLARSRELAFLANTLLAGSPFSRGRSRPRKRPMRLRASATWVSNAGSAASRRVPRGSRLVTAFEAGWSVLYKDVSLFVADQLIATLADLRCVDADTRHGLRALRRTLVEQREAGTPWLARDAADVLAMLDMTAWISVLGLLDECPILPAALTAVLERRTTSVSPTAFEFISTTAQIGDIRLFMRTLRGCCLAERALGPLSERHDDEVGRIATVRPMPRRTCCDGFCLALLPHMDRGRGSWSFRAECVVGYRHKDPNRSSLRSQV